MPTKSELSARVAAGELDEVFHNSHFGGFWVSQIRRILKDNPKRWPIKSGFLTAELVGSLVKQHEIDPQRVRSFLPHQACDACYLVKIDSGDHIGEHVVIDGTHRILALWAHGLSSFTFYEIPLSEAPLVDVNDPAVFREHPWGEMEVTKDGLKKRNT